MRQRVSRGLATMRRPAQVRLAAERVLEETLTYSFGAGHDVPLAACAPSRGLDCSSFVSLALRRAGLLASERALSSREIAVDWGVAGEGDHITVWAGGGHAWLEFKLAGERAERLQVGPDATEWRMRVAARERRARASSCRATGPGCDPRSVRAGHDLDAQAVGIEQVRRVVARAVVVARAGRAVVGAAGRERGLVGGVDGGAAAGGEGDVAEARARAGARGRRSTAARR